MIRQQAVPDCVAVPECVEVRAPARLHMGFMDLHGGLGRRFGGVGVGVQEIAWRLRVSRAGSGVVLRGADGKRARQLACSMLKRLSIRDGVCIDLVESVPAHIGLGSGTQLSLALGTAISLLFDRAMPVSEVVRFHERGRRSGIGIGSFSQGGLIIDGGRVEGGAPAPVIVREPFPEDWCLLLVFDKEYTGLSGQRERTAFSRLESMSDRVSGQICRRVLMQLLPALRERDCAGAGAAIDYIQRQMGRCFQSFQGGVYCNPLLAEVLTALRKSGATGGGQSSWGPTGFALFPDRVTARRALARMRAAWRSVPSLDFSLCRGSNDPASVTLHWPSD